MKKIMSIGLALIVLMVVAIGCPAPTPTPTLTPTPTPNSHNGQGVITIQEFINNAQAGKYKTGDVLEVSATYEGGISLGAVYTHFYFGPKVGELVLMARVMNSSSDILPFTGGRLHKGDTVVLRGGYEGIIEMPDGNGKIKGAVLGYCEIISN